MPGDSSSYGGDLERTSSISRIMLMEDGTVCAPLCEEERDEPSAAPSCDSQSLV